MNLGRLSKENRANTRQKNYTKRKEFFFFKETCSSKENDKTVTKLKQLKTACDADFTLKFEFCVFFFSFLDKRLITRSARQQ